MFNEEKLKTQLADRNLMAKIVRIGRFPDGELSSSRLIVERIIAKRGCE
jgi:hypothetical protein